MTEQAIIAQDAIDRFVALLGPKGVITDADDIAPWVSDWRGRYHGTARAILSPATTREVAGCVALAAELGIALVPQGGNTSMVGGATPPADGSALILSLRFHRATAWLLLALFVVQFPITSTTGRLVLCGVYGALTVVGLIINRRHIVATLRAPFRADDHDGDGVRFDGRELSIVGR